MNQSFNLKARLKAALIHISISALIASMAAWLVFGLWYAWPYRLISGGQDLFLIVLSVDLVLGPMLTFVVFNQSKTRSHLARDLAVVALLQLAGLAYGIHTVFLARPVAVVFEADRFRVITNVDILEEEMPQALPELRALSLTGPKIMGTRLSEKGDEQVKSVDLALKGFDSATRPSYWVPYKGEVVSRAIQRARPLAILSVQYRDHAKEIEAAIRNSQRPAESLKFLPLTGRQTDWCALIDASTGTIVGFVHVDGFF